MAATEKKHEQDGGCPGDMEAIERSGIAKRLAFGNVSRGGVAIGRDLG
jgi:hypothetical protein